MSEKVLRRAKAEAKAVRLKEKREQHKSRAALEMQLEQTKNTEIWQSFIESYTADPKGDSDSNSGKQRDGDEHPDEVQKLCARGIPPNMRGAVWPLLIGTKIHISDQEFKELRVKADELRSCAGLGSFTPSPKLRKQAQKEEGQGGHDQEDGEDRARGAGECV